MYDGFLATHPARRIPRARDLARAWLLQRPYIALQHAAPAHRDRARRGRRTRPLRPTVYGRRMLQLGRAARSIRLDRSADRKQAHCRVMTEIPPVTSSSAVLDTPLEAGDVASTARPAGDSGRARNAAPPAAATPLGLDKAAIESLLAKEYAGLRLLISRRVGDSHLAADLLNDAVCTTWEKWCAGKIERPEQLGGYIFQVAMNLLRNHRRAASVRSAEHVQFRLVEELPDGAASRDMAIEDDIAARVKDLIRSMNSQRDRTVLVRFYLNEEDKQSICQDLRLTALQFDKVLHRARERLRELLETRGLKRTDLFCLLLFI
jgi:RNA polymerase sigma-70 factor, ECF subfamily